MISDELQARIKDRRMSCKSKTVNGNKYNILCYTKNQFFNHSWDKLAITHRGKIYDQDGNAINHPMDKVFNIDEQETTSFFSVLSRMNHEQFEVLDKMNGHLVIVSNDPKNNVVLTSTKGSFQGMAEQDEEILVKSGAYRVIKRMNRGMTHMFECIADYDPHLHLTAQKKKYCLTSDALVLIAATDADGRSLNYQELQTEAFILGVPIVKCINVSNPKEFLDAAYGHTGIEGYVIHFPNSGFRVKLKTDEYLRLRYLKELTPKRILNIFRKGGVEALYNQYDEELYPAIDRVMDIYVDYIYRMLVNSVEITDVLNSELTGRELFANPWGFTKEQLCLINAVTIKGMKARDFIIGSRQCRETFYNAEGEAVDLVKAEVEKFFELKSA
jgi:hypothetical protein